MDKTITFWLFTLNSTVVEFLWKWFNCFSQTCKFAICKHLFSFYWFLFVCVYFCSLFFPPILYMQFQQVYPTQQFNNHFSSGRHPKAFKLWYTCRPLGSGPLEAPSTANIYACLWILCFENNIPQVSFNCYFRFNSLHGCNITFPPQLCWENVQWKTKIGCSE